MSSPLLIKQLATTEDNLYYYGFYLFFLYFLFNKKYDSIKDGLISGALLGLAIWMHVSPMVFVCIAALLPFNLDRIKIAICSASSVVFYFIFHLFTHFGDFWNGSFLLAFKQWPLIVYLNKAFSFERGAPLEGHSFFEQLIFGFESMNGHYRLIGHIAWLCLIAFFVFNFKNIRFGLKGWGLILISFLPILMWEPYFGERWDFFVLTLFFLLIQFGSQVEWKLPHLLVAFMTLMAVNTGALLLSGAPYKNQKSQMVVEFKEVLPKAKKKNKFIFDIRFLKIDPFVVSHFGGKEKDIYFSDGKSFYQTYFSLMAKGDLNINHLWQFKHFEAWNVIDAPGEPLGVREVTDGCQVTRGENVYISESLIESIKKNCDG